TLPPNKPTVWKVIRAVRFEAGHEPTMTALRAGLGEKYGKESFSLITGIEISLYWIRDGNGVLVEGTQANDYAHAFEQVYGVTLQSELLLRPGNQEMAGQLRTTFYQSGIGHAAAKLPLIHQESLSNTYIVARLSSSVLNPELARQMVVESIDASLDSQATKATQAAIAKANETKAGEELEKAKARPIPKL